MTPDQVDEDFLLGKKWVEDHLRLPEDQILRYTILTAYYQELGKLAKKALKNARAAK